MEKRTIIAAAALAALSAAPTVADATLRVDAGKIYLTEFGKTVQVADPRIVSIAPDGSSIFPARRGVIPVSCSLFTATGPVVFESIGSDTDTANDDSYLDFQPNKSFTFA
jgi:hypothetical protein